MEAYMALAVMTVESTLTDRYQTTVPSEVREALGLSKRDKLTFSIKADGTVVVTKSAAADDPVLGTFLNFLARDMTKHPQRLQGVPAELLAQARDLVRGVEVDFDAPLDDDDE
jgi:antitoxin PrlF